MMISHGQSQDFVHVFTMVSLSSVSKKRYTIECRYGSYDGQNVMYAYISESHANQLERDIDHLDQIWV